jgi:hypothetical protein
MLSAWSRTIEAVDIKPKVRSLANLQVYNPGLSKSPLENQIDFVDSCFHIMLQNILQYSDYVSHFASYSGGNVNS